MTVVVLFFGSDVYAQAASATAEPPETCVLLCNIDFEDVPFPITTFRQLDESLVSCWNTTNPDGTIEIWTDGFGLIDSYEGDYFAELNSTRIATLYQTFQATAGQEIVVSFAHRGRYTLPDSMSVSIGPDSHGDFEVLGVFGDDLTAWGVYTLPYTLPITGAMELRFNSLSSNGGTNPNGGAGGNFLDAVSISCPGSICGINFNDLDEDGLMGVAEPVLPDWTIELSGVASASTVTGVDGEFCFPSLAPGSYVVSQVDQDGWVQTAPAAPGTFGVDIEAGENITGLAFGIHEAVSPNGTPDAAPDLVTTPEDTPITVDVLANDTDPDGDELTVSIASHPSNGTVQLGEDGTITYTPNANFFGEDRFDYTATDPSGASDTEAVRINVTPINDPPVAVDDVAETDGGSAVIIAVLENDSDVESVVAISAVGNPENGTAIDNGDGTITYTPEEGFFGEDSFSYSITDGELTIEATVTVTVNSTNNAPVANNDAAIVYTGETVQINLLGNDTDVDGDDLSIISIGMPAQGAVSDNGDGTITYTPNTEVSGGDTFTYTISDGIDTAEGTVTVTIASPGLEGDGVDVPVEDGVPGDGDGNGDGVLDSIQDNVTSLPIAQGENEGFYLTVVAPAGQSLSKVQSIGNPSPGDFPVDVSSPAEFLSYSVSGVPESGTVITIIYHPDVQVNAYLKYGPTPDDPMPHWYNFGFDGRTGAIIVPGRIQLFFRDGERGDHDLMVNGAVLDPGGPVFLETNAAPVAVEDEITLDEDSTVQIDVLANDTDADNDELTLILESVPTHGLLTLDGNLFTYTPGADFFGEDSFTYMILDPDGAASVAIVTITVTPVQDPPVAVDDEATTMENIPITFSLFVNDFDVDGDNFWLSSQDDALHGVSVYNFDGTVTYTPEPGFIGTDTWVYTITDGPAASGAIVFGSITVMVTANPNPSSKEISQELPTEIYLNQNYPNPFNPSTTIEFGLPESSAVRIDIFDVQGRLVKVLVSETLPAGRHSRQIQMGDVPSGIYLYRLTAGGRSYSRTLQLVK